MDGKNLLRHFDTFIFDWDGTLRPMSALQRVNEAINPSWRHKKAVSTKYFDMYNGQAHQNTVKSRQTRLPGRVPKWPSEGEQLKGGMLKLVDISLFLSRPRLHYGAKETLKAIASSKKKIALFTDGNLYRVGREMSRLGVEKYFGMVLSAQSIKRLKPDPAGVEIILKKLGAQPSRTLYIGDRPDDIIAAKLAGTKSAAVTDGFSSMDVLIKYSPNYIFKNIEEFRKAL
ncbi:MAG: HAD family hydrolase [Candidatus Micrarchaeales archaeon]|jgi:FMN phosphatase YigB (HAD superfamily)|uniref:HAD-superfamily hydrolase, subfamily IA, variant 1 n=1 Tax=Candidatus Micrarchaeum acidiphilum ARMAN-2 TaxID=425595 RepID=C7DGU0_MICA2|nr:MAG: HAD-superfamily hydrolase, subfamily IA, variant 1 [Candidatus Micrarchaeum acidiphilum ARMAN-2]MCW6161511.1 HAD family hydrolase [Candidatus Micrarchaeales archaeon]